MIKGMTGFGSTQLTSGAIKAVVEIKSVNHRYCDISNYLPTGFSSIENKIRQIIQKQLSRGKINVSVKIIQKPTQTITLNKNAVMQHLKYAKKIAKEFKIENNISMSDMIKLPGVLETKEVFISPDEIWGSLEKCTKKALSSVVKMRKSEGRSISVDVSDKLKKMTAEIKRIKTRAKVVLSQKKKIFSPEEFKSFQKSNDINEEVSRLEHFIGAARALLKSTGSAGKKIDFVAQEMQRETNTIGSKLQDKIVTSSVISLKSQVEKIREQAQNIE